MIGLRLLDITTINTEWKNDRNQSQSLPATHIHGLCGRDSDSKWALYTPSPWSNSWEWALHHRHPGASNLLTSPLLYPPLPPKDTEELGFSPRVRSPVACVSLPGSQVHSILPPLTSLFLKPCEPTVVPFPPQDSPLPHTPQVSTSPQPIQKEEEFMTLRIWNSW